MDDNMKGHYISFIGADGRLYDVQVDFTRILIPTCPYAKQLRRHDGRWYTLAIQQCNEQRVWHEKIDGKLYISLHPSISKQLDGLFEEMVLDKIILEGTNDQ